MIWQFFYVRWDEFQMLAPGPPPWVSCTNLKSHYCRRRNPNRQWQSCCVLSSLLPCLMKNLRKKVFFQHSRPAFRKSGSRLEFRRWDEFQAQSNSSHKVDGSSSYNSSSSRVMSNKANNNIFLTFNKQLKLRIQNMHNLNWVCPADPKTTLS